MGKRQVVVDMRTRFTVNIPDKVPVLRTKEYAMKYLEKQMDELVESKKFDAVAMSPFKKGA